MKIEVAIVIPIYKSTLDQMNEVSLAQCFRILGKRKISFLTHRGINLSSYYQIADEVLSISPEVVYVEEHHLSSISSYNKLLLSSGFYKMFLDYDYILIYQDDCYVFEDCLDFWLNQDIDYVGAPWVKIDQNKLINFRGVGNGGLSLRRTKIFYDIFSSYIYVNRLSQIWDEYRKMNWRGWLGHFFGLIYGISLGSLSHEMFNSFRGNEDEYIGLYLKDSLKIPTSETALLFAFECEPEQLFHLAGKMPFGIHAWWKYGKKFMMDRLKSDGYHSFLGYDKN